MFDKLYSLTSQQALRVQSRGSKIIIIINSIIMIQFNMSSNTFQKVHSIHQD